VGGEQAWSELVRISAAAAWVHGQAVSSPAGRCESARLPIRASDLIEAMRQVIDAG
jgi:hypothetical protein